MHDLYQSPFSQRYAGKHMQHLFSEEKKFVTWRKLWIALAEAEKELGLPITEEQIEAMKAHATDINYDVAAAREKEVRHDVMAHVYAFGKQAEVAAPIMHLGATSCYVTDNADIIIMKEALAHLKVKLLAVMGNLAAFAEKHKAMPALGFTHFQPAQLTTVGKRACLWLYDLLLDFEEVTHVIEGLKLRGVKGTTGTQMSFLYLFDGDHEKVKALEKRVVEKMGFQDSVPVSGQTVTRKMDAKITACLSGIAQTAAKFSNDLRLLQNLKEMEEPFEKNQIGSSAMPYKRNPMRSERIAALARHLMCTAQNAPFTAATQWFERTLDDSANKRLAMAEAFLAADGILDIFINVTDGLVVYPKVIAAHVAAELPFMATEAVLMAAVKKGGNRQELHERIRTHAMAAAAQVKEEGRSNDLLERIAADPEFDIDLPSLQAIVEPLAFTGRAQEQTEEFLQTHIKPLLEANPEYKTISAHLHV